MFIISVIGCGIMIYKYPSDVKSYALSIYYKISNKDKLVIPLELDTETNIYYVKAKLNDVPMKFILDTGCSMVLINKRDAEFLLHNDIITKDNSTKNVETVCANGYVETNETIIIDTIEIEGAIVNDVPCLISTTDKSPLLLGQSVLSRFKKVTIDYNNNLLIIEK